jgi:hypothetical protein
MAGPPGHCIRKMTPPDASIMAKPEPTLCMASADGSCWIIAWAVQLVIRDRSSCRHTVGSTSAYALRNPIGAKDWRRKQHPLGFALRSMIFTSSD